MVVLLVRIVAVTVVLSVAMPITWRLGCSRKFILVINTPTGTARAGLAIVATLATVNVVSCVDVLHRGAEIGALAWSHICTVESTIGMAIGLFTLSRRHVLKTLGEMEA